MKIEINIAMSTIEGRVAKNLAIIGKRAKDVSGNSLFSDITTSSRETPVFNELMISAADTIVSELHGFAGIYSMAGSSLKFTLSSTRWTHTDADGNDHDLTEALRSAIENYIFNYTIGQYLAIIHPSTGEKYPPIYGSTFMNQCAVIMQNIITLCNTKRPQQSAPKSYEDISYDVLEEEYILINGEKRTDMQVENGDSVVIHLSTARYDGKQVSVNGTRTPLMSAPVGVIFAEPFVNGRDVEFEVNVRSLGTLKITYVSNEDNEQIFPTV